MVKRKVQSSTVEVEKPRVRANKKPKVDMTKLADAVVEGKVVAQVGERIYFERMFSGGKKKVHAGILKEINVDKGVLGIWDETAEQFYAISLRHELPAIKLG
jgi:hypothetical protein